MTQSSELIKQMMQWLEMHRSVFGQERMYLRGGGRQRRTVYRVEGPFLRRPMPDLPFVLIGVRGQVWQRAKRKKRRDPVFYLVNAVKHEGQWRLPFPIDLLLTWA